MKLPKFLQFRDDHKVATLFYVLIGSVLYAIGIKWFLEPAQLYAGGFTGIAQLISNLSEYLIGVDLPISITWFVLNIPVFFLGYGKVGKRFTILSIVSVFLGSLAMNFVVIGQLGAQLPIVQDKMLNAICGGVISGIGVGLTLKRGASTGGMDIISQYLSDKGGRSVGAYSFIINAVIIAIAGSVYGWEIALFTLINLFISSVVIDKFHTRHHKLALFIVTNHKEELVEEIHKRVYRGITLIPAQGAYSKQDKSILFMVIQSYQLYNIVNIITEVDPQAFTNVTKSQGVYGNFLKNKIG
ncbi:YitT family protein [Haloplasma contractile]|uniref:Membrane protein YitT n=1 Tax=Haloplasma contractile SSD-17B TaxID=1033810 RepID=U2EFI5_9MOLU|nr:YitT family protein [Haloplasma contractile]ERJ13421.1 membrane protein YitT [Haloplasma contractile SSD-17B]